MTAVDIAAPFCVIGLAMMLLAWGGYLAPGSYTPRFTSAVDASHGVTVLCRRNLC